MYNDKVMDHFKNPHNMGEIKDADGIGEVGNLVCGDVMHLYIKVGQNKKGEEIIKDVKFKTLGCVAAIATSSVVTDLAKGKTLKQASAIKKVDIVEALRELPPIKIHCSILATKALAEAIYDYQKKNNKEISADLEKKHQAIQKEHNQH